MNSCAVLSFPPRREPKVSYFQLVVRAQEQVLWLQIPMDHPCRPVQVLYGIKHLGEVVTGELLREPARFVFLFDEGEQVALLDEFKNYEEYLNALA